MFISVIKVGPHRPSVELVTGPFRELSVCMNFLSHFGKGLQVMAQMTVPPVEALVGWAVFENTL